MNTISDASSHSSRSTRRLIHRAFWLWFVVASCIFPAAVASQQPQESQLTKTEPSTIELTLKTRVPLGELTDTYHSVEQSKVWDPKRTAVVVCDMWDSHHCYNSVIRVGQLAPKMDQFVAKARSLGMTIIHSPSSCMDFYAGHPARQRAIDTPAAASFPDQIQDWCHQIPAEEKGEYPIDQTDGGEDDDPAEHEKWARELAARGLDPKEPWKRQIETISIDSKRDYVTYDGKEVWSIMEKDQIDNVLMVGVHTNMCVLGRPFGLRQLVKNGKNVALVRDLTDTMYNPAAKPYVNHHTGTDLIVEHIEKFVCPTLTSDQLLGGAPFQFPGDKRPRIAVLVGEREYGTNQTLPKFAIQQLGKDYKVDFIHANPNDRNDFPMIETIAGADALLVSVRRRTLPKEQLDVVRKFVASGKPVIGIRTANHAFCNFDKEPPTEKGLDHWPEFDAEIFGGNYHGHHNNDEKTVVSVADPNRPHAVLEEIAAEKLAGNGSLYQVDPISDKTVPLLSGSIADQPAQPIAWFFHRKDGGLSFYTSLGAADDFEYSQFQKLLKNAIDHCVRSSKVTKQPVNK